MNIKSSSINLFAASYDINLHTFGLDSGPATERLPTRHSLPGESVTSRRVLPAPAANSVVARPLFTSGWTGNACCMSGVRQRWLTVLFSWGNDWIWSDLGFGRRFLLNQRTCTDIGDVRWQLCCICNYDIRISYSWKLDIVKSVSSKLGYRSGPY